MKDSRTPEDQAVRDRIVRDLGTSFAVEAGAGTGKTSLLTDRIIEAVRTGHARLNEIVAITFTDRAANELKVRLRDGLEKLLAEAGGDEAERLVEALAALDAAHVSTIHSFASELLRERPVEAGIDPGFAISDALEASLLFDRVWARWLARQLDEERGPVRPAFLAGLTAERLREFADFLRANPGIRPAGERVDPGPMLDQFTGEFAPAARELAERIQKKCPSPECSCMSKLAEAVRIVDRLADADPDEILAAMPLLPNLTVKRATNACENKDLVRLCKHEVSALEESLGSMRQVAAHWILCGLAGALRGMVAEYEKEKLSRALLDFDDLLLKARDLLRDRREVREYFQRRFKMILVDECQDTDPLQTEIALFLAEDGPKASSWRDVRVAPGKLLFVGDPKQSIYRFRRADIETYEEAKQVVGRSGESVNISQNFRSSASCVRWFNAVFAELIQRPDDGDYQPAYVPLDAWRTDSATAVTVLRPPENASCRIIDDTRTAEADAVAAEIRTMVERGDTVLEKGTDQVRPVRFGDFAVLFRTRTSFGIYENTFALCGVPFRAVSGKDFYARQEVVELRVVLAAVERPHDPAAVVAALRTSLLGVSDNELAAAADRGFDYLARADEQDDTYLHDVFRMLARWHRARSSTDPSALVQRVLSETKALELFFLKPGGEQRAANLTKIIDDASGYERTPDATFGGFVRWVEERTTASEEAESPLDDEDGDFVKLVTIHKAKGLEFPVVVLADLAGERQKRDNFVVNRREGTFDMKLGSRDLGIRTLGFEAATEYEKLREEAESRRLLYVAATRARDRLIIPHFPTGDKAGGYLKYLVDLAEDAAAAAKEVTTEVIAAPADPALHETRAFRIGLDGEPPGQCSKLCEERGKWLDARATLIAGSAAGKRLKTASGLREHEDLGPAARENRLGRTIGQAVHAVLEQVDLATGSGLAGLAAEEAARHGIPDRQPLVQKLAENALKMETVGCAAKAGTLYREVPFAVCVGGTILEGLIDLAFDDGSGLVIADYKTDDVPGDNLAEHAEAYRSQIGAYALAVREVFGTLPKSASLVFLRAGREVSVEVDDKLIKSVSDIL